MRGLQYTSIFERHPDCGRDQCSLTTIAPNRRSVVSSLIRGNPSLNPRLGNDPEIGVRCRTSATPTGKEIPVLRGLHIGLIKRDVQTPLMGRHFEVYR